MLLFWLKGVYEKIISALVVDSSGAKRGVCPLCFGTFMAYIIMQNPIAMKRQ